MISSEKVSRIFTDCLLKKEEIVENKSIVKTIYVEGISAKFGLHSERIAQYSEDIKAFVNELPEEFKEGWSFLNLCWTKDGEQWTGFHKICEQLMVLGIASKEMKYCCPKKMWNMLPFKMPYVKIV